MTLKTLLGKKEKVACKNCCEPTTFASNGTIIVRLTIYDSKSSHRVTHSQRD